METFHEGLRHNLCLSRLSTTRHQRLLVLIICIEDRRSEKTSNFKVIIYPRIAQVHFDDSEGLHFWSMPILVLCRRPFESIWCLNA